MNNLKQKNVIYGQDSKSVLPHSSAESVCLNQNSNVTDARINNAAQQLLNNDLYIENRIAMGLNYKPGPVRLADGETPAGLPNGSKRWVGSDDPSKPLRILRKVDSSMQSSISRVRARSVNFVAAVGDIVFAAYGDTLMYDAGGGFAECRCDGQKVVAVNYCTGQGGTFFASDDAVYELVQTVQGDQSVECSLAKIETVPLSGVKCVAYDSDENMLYVGGDQVLRGRYDKNAKRASLAADVKFSLDETYGGSHDAGSYADVSVNAIQLLDRRDPSVNVGGRSTHVLAATDFGLYRSDDRSFLTVTAQSFSGLPSGGRCLFVAERNGVLYALCSDNKVYRHGEDGTFAQYPSSVQFQNSAGLVSHASGLYVACQSGVYRYEQFWDNPSPRLEYSLTNCSAVAVSQVFEDRIVFAAAGAVVHYYKTPLAPSSFSLPAGWQVKQLVAQPRKGTAGTLDVYALAENGASAAVFATRFAFGGQRVTDYSRHVGAERVADDVEAAAYCGDECCYASGGYLYSADRPAALRRLGDVTVYDMSYSSEDNTIAVATDRGVYVVRADTFETLQSDTQTPQSDVKLVSQSDIVYYATDQQIYAAQKSRGGLNSSQAVSAPASKTFKGVEAAGDAAYVLFSDGSLQSVGRHYVTEATQVAAASEEDDTGGSSPMDFPVMPYMEEVSPNTAIGVSAGAAYAITYAPEAVDETPGEVEQVDFVDANGAAVTNISGLCTVGQAIFAANASTVFRYDISAETFEDNDFSALRPTATASVPNVNRLVYSGTDMTFDMRIYAQTASLLSVYTPGTATATRLQADGLMDGLVMYTDQFGDDEDPVNRAVVIGVRDGHLSVNISNIDMDSDAWQAGETVAGRTLGEWYGFQMPDVEGQTNRRPYAMFFCSNSRIYVAYTASAGAQYVDCIAAVPTNSFEDQNGTPGTPDFSDFCEIGPVSGPNDGQISFSGFDVERREEEQSSDPDADNEDIDVLAVYGKSEHKLVTFKVDSNLAQSFSDTRSEVYLDDVPGYDSDAEYFQADCAKFGSEDSAEGASYYVMLAPRPADGKMRVLLFKYDYSQNRILHREPQQYLVTGIPSSTAANVSGVFVVGSPSDSSRVLKLAVTVKIGGSSIAVYEIDVPVFEGQNDAAGTPWSRAKRVTLKNGNNVSFVRVMRCGITQLLAQGTNLLCELQSKSWFTGISNIGTSYITNNIDSRDYVLVQSNSAASVPYQISTVDQKVTQMSFGPAKVRSGASSANFNVSGATLSKANGALFAIDWSGGRIYKEAQDGVFDQAAAFASGSVPSGVVDGCVCYVDEQYYVCALKSDMSAVLYKIDLESGGLSLYFTYENVVDEDQAFLVRTVYPQIRQGFGLYVQRHVVGADDTLPRNQLPIFAQAEPDSPGDFIYLDPEADPQLRLTALRSAGSPFAGKTYFRVGRDGEQSYAARYDSGAREVVVQALPGGAELVRLALGSAQTASISDVWLAGGICYVANAGTVVYYHAGSWLHAAGGGGDATDESTLDVIGAAGRRCFLIHDRILVAATYVDAYPLIGEPVQAQVQPVGLPGTPVRLASGRVYAGCVYVDDEIQRLGILWPDGTVTAQPASDSGTGASEYSAVAVFAHFDSFPDGWDNPSRIVPLGDFLGEIVVCEGGYLHIAQVSDRLLIQDRYGQCTVPVVKTLPWTDFAQNLPQGVAASAKSAGARYIASASGSLCSFSDASSGLAMKILSQSMKSDRANAKSFCQTGQNAFLVPTNVGVYRYIHIEGTPVVSRMSASGLNARQVTSYDFTGADETYLMVNGGDNSLYESTNGRTWKKTFKPVASGSLVSVYPKNAHEWYFGATTGLYKSSYRYTEVDDIQKFGEDDLYSLYSELMSSDISSDCESLIAGHETSRTYATGHVSSLVSYVNDRLLGVDFDGLQSSGWQRKTGQISQSDTVQAPVAKIVTWNIAHAGRSDLLKVAARIKSLEPDVVCLQEVDKNVPRSGSVDQADEIRERLGDGWKCYFAKAFDVDGGEYGLAVLAKTAAAATPQTVQLTPVVPSDEQRIMQIARFSRYIFVNTHLSNRGTQTQIQSHVNQIVAKLNELRSAYPSLPIYVCGDFNMDSSFAEFRSLLETAREIGPGTWTTTDRSAYDHILTVQPASGGFQAAGASVVTASGSESDHYPVTVTAVETQSASTTPGQTLDIVNDVVFEQGWGDQSSWDVQLSAQNRFVKLSNPKFTYMFKRWMSGVTELYVHVPSTNTYYINHVPSTPQYSIGDEELTASNMSQFGRDKQVFSHDPNDSYTTMTLSLNRYAFSVDALLGVQACGNSLPLKIYKENIESNGKAQDYEAAQYFNSYIAPTVLMSRRVQGNDIVFDFACFGADEQVIRLDFMDNTNGSGQAYYRLVFNPNGISMSASDYATQRVKADGTKFTVRRNQYRWTNDQKVFSGWSLTRSGDNPDPSTLNGFIADGQEMTSTQLANMVGAVTPGQDIVLYAVWTTYQFGSGDTTLGLRPSSGSVRFQLGSAQTAAESDRVIVKFEDVQDGAQ